MLKLRFSIDVDKYWQNQMNSCMFQEEVASLRGLKTTTVVSHLCEAIKVGLEVDPVRVGVTSQIESLITRVIRGPEINSGGWKNSQKSTQVGKKNSGWEKCPEINSGG